MIENYAPLVSSPDVLLPEQISEEESQSPGQHLDYSGHVPTSVQDEIRSLETEACQQVLELLTMLPAIYEIIVETTLLEFHHDRRHLDQLCMCAQEEMNHVPCPQIGFNIFFHGRDHNPT